MVRTNGTGQFGFVFNVLIAMWPRMKPEERLSMAEQLVAMAGALPQPWPPLLHRVSRPSHVPAWNSGTSGAPSPRSIVWATRSITLPVPRQPRAARPKAGGRGLDATPGLVGHDAMLPAFTERDPLTSIRPGGRRRHVVAEPTACRDRDIECRDCRERPPARMRASRRGAGGEFRTRSTRVTGSGVGRLLAVVHTA